MALVCYFSKGKNDLDIRLDSGFDSLAKFECFCLSLGFVQKGHSVCFILLKRL